jgi:hypothetical protein
MNNWIYNPNGTLPKEVTSIEDLPNYEEAVGFVYKITNTVTGRFYIGKKSLYSERKTKISDREKAQTKTRKTFKRVVKESNWKKYYGSCEELNFEIEIAGPQYFKREILEVCCSKKYLGYCEIAHQIKNDVLTSNSYNGNIMGKYFPSDMDNCNQ